VPAKRISANSLIIIAILFYVFCAPVDQASFPHFAASMSYEFEAAHKNLGEVYVLACDGKWSEPFLDACTADGWPASLQFLSSGLRVKTSVLFSSLIPLPAGSDQASSSRVLRFQWK
jgi:hypothetical protein